MMGAFNYEYKWFPYEFQRNPPVDLSKGKKRFYQYNE